MGSEGSLTGLAIPAICELASFECGEGLGKLPYKDVAGYIPDWVLSVNQYSRVGMPGLAISIPGRG